MAYFKKLRIWQDSIDLTKRIYAVTREGSFSKDYGLTNQIQRAAVSIPSNIAEGDERKSDKESIRFLYIAKASAAEVVTQLIIAKEIGYISEDTFHELEDHTEKLKASIRSLINSREN